MKKTPVIAYSNLPLKPPFIGTAVIYLLLDKFQVSEIIWGIIGTVVVLYWVLYFLSVIFIQETRNIFEETK